MAYRRVLEDGREIAVYPRLFNSIIVVGPAEGRSFDNQW